MCKENPQQTQQQQQSNVQTQTMQQEAQQQVQQNLMQNVHADPMQQTAAPTQAVDAHALYLQQTATMQDTATLGNSSFKAKKAAKQKLRETEKQVGQKFLYSTAYTAETSQTLTARLAEHTELKNNTTKTKFKSMLNTLLFFNFTPQMFLSSEIRTHLNEYMELVQNYEYLKKNCPDLRFEPRALPAFEAMEPMIQQLKRRLTLYCEKNGVALDGTPVQQQNDDQLTQEDIENWYQTVRHFNDPDAEVTIQPTDAQRTEQRERNMETAPANPVQIPTNQELRELSQELQKTCKQTHSDELAEAFFARLRKQGDLLQSRDVRPVKDALNNYVQNSRYKVGYTKERANFKRLVAECKSALKNPNLSSVEKKNVKKLLDDLNKGANGTLNVTLAECMDQFVGKRPKETGPAGRGHKRNAMIRTFTSWSDQSDEPLFAHPPVVNDIKQRLVSNCYMMAATAGLVNCSPALLRSCIKDNNDGTVTVRLFERRVVESAEPASAPDTDDPDLDGIEVVGVEKTELRPIYVRVSKEVPQIGGADALSAGALWMQMIEKACAFIGRGNVTGYQSLWYGDGGEFLERLIGVSPEYDSTKTQEDKDDLFERICHCVEQRTVFHAGSKAEKDGLNTKHAYTILGGVVKNGKRYVLLRNPYSTHSLKYNEDGSREMTGMPLSTSSDATYGQFYMPYEDFLNDFEHFSHTDLNKYQK